MIGKCADSANKKILAYAAEYNTGATISEIESMLVLLKGGNVELHDGKARQFWKLTIEAYNYCDNSGKNIVRVEIERLLNRMKTLVERGKTDE